MTLALSAPCYLDAWERRSAIPGGLAFEPLLRRIVLDYSPASLARIDTFLDALRTAKKPQPETFLAEHAAQNLLFLLAFYVGEVIGRSLRCAPEWRAFEDTEMAQLQGELGQRSFANSMLCDFPGSGARLGRFAPLMAICTRLFTSGGEKSVAFSAAALIPPELRASTAPLLPAPGFGYPLELQQALAALPAREAAQLKMLRPPWVADDPLKRLFDAAPDLLRTGRIAWAGLIQANNTLFTPGRFDGAPGEVVYDPTGRASAPLLDFMAQALFSLKGKRLSDPALAAFSDYLADETTRVFGLDVPEAVSPYPLKVASTFFDRNYLPGTVIAQRCFPVLVSDAHPGMVLFLPAAVWPAVLLQGWRR